VKEISLAPEQIDAIENLLFFLFALLSVPFAWLYAQKRGRPPWLWSLFAFFIAWVAVLLLRLLPVGGSESLQRVAEAKGDEADDAVLAGRIDDIEAEQNLRKLLGKKTT
jgi:uncharacterized Fe-S cluster-containing MiaB family protein